MKDRDSFAKATVGKENLAGGMSTHSERAKMIDKNNKYTDFPTFNSEESWEHVTLCNKNKQIRDE